MNNKKDSGASGVADLPLPANWSMKMSKSYPGKMYYVNKVTKESSWRHPLDKTPTNKKKTGSAPHLASHKSTKGTNSMEDASSSCSSTPNLGPSAVSAISHLSEEEQVHVMGFKSKTQQKSAPLMSLATDSNNSTLNDSVIYLRTDPNNSTLNDSVICLHSDPADTKKSEAKAIPEESSSKECSDKRKTRSKKKKKKKKKSKGAPELEKQSDAKAERILGKDSRCDLKYKLAVSPSQEMTSKGLSLSDCNVEKVTSTPSSGACLSNSRPVLKAKRRSKGLEEDSSAKHSQVNRVEPAAVSQENTEKGRQADIVLDPLPMGRDSYHDHSTTSSSSSNFGFRDAPILPSVSDSSVIIVEPNDYSTDQRADSSVIVLDNTHDVIDLCTPMKRRRVSSKSDGTLTLPTRPQLTMISHINLLAKKQDVGCESMSHKVKEVMPVASPEKIANEMKRKKPGLPGECSSEKSSREIAYNESTSELPREKSSAYGAEAVLSSKKSVEQCEISTQQQPSQSSAAFPLPGDVGVNDGLADGTDATETVREIEDMDFEEVGEIVLLNIQNLRRNSSHLTCAPIGTLTEAVAKSPLVSSPVVIKIEESPEKHKALILVVDTNVLISCLTFLSEIMNADLPGLGIPTLVLPWVVMQELDFIKDSRKRRDRYNEMTWRRAVEAVHFIHAKLNTKDQNLIGQPPKEAYQKTDMVISSNDDRILQCCVQWKEKCPDDHVILLSRDLNLTNKSVIMGISAANTETLWNELRMPKPNLKLLQKPPSNETTQKGNQNVAATSGKSKNSEGSHVKQLFLSEAETKNQKQLPVRYNKATTKVNSTDAPPSLLSLPCQQPVNSSRNVYNNPTLQKTCVPGISAPSTEDRPASLSNTQENLNQVAKNVTHKPTSKHLQPQSSSNWDKPQEQTSVCFVESSQSVSSSSGVVPGTRTERVQSDEPMESATESASGNTGKNLDPTSEPARELRATQSETASPAASVTECESLVLSKFQNIWTFITEFRDELIKVLNEGQSHAEFPMAVAALRRVGSLMIELMEKFTECLDLSPVILQDRQLEFKAFAECLNNFLLRTEVNVTKTTPPLDHRQLIGYFSATKSRPQLKAGLEELSGFIKLFQEMSGQIFAAASS